MKKAWVIFVPVVALLLSLAPTPAKADSFGPVIMEAIADASPRQYSLGQANLTITANEDLESLTIHSVYGFQHSLGLKMIFSDGRYTYVSGRQDLVEEETFFLYNLKRGDKITLKLRFAALSPGADTWHVTAEYPGGQATIAVTWRVTPSTR